MNKLKIALDIISKRAEEQQLAGEVPSFLGIRGMLALMYDRIRAFSKEPDDISEYVIDLAIKAIFAVAECLPNTEKIDLPDDEPRGEEEEQDDFIAEKNEIARIEEDAEDNDRWTPVSPGTPLPNTVASDEDDKA